MKLTGGTRPKKVKGGWVERKVKVGKGTLSDNWEYFPKTLIPFPWVWLFVGDSVPWLGDLIALRALQKAAKS